MLTDYKQASFLLTHKVEYHFADTNGIYFYHHI